MTGVAALILFGVALSEIQIPFGYLLFHSGALAGQFSNGSSLT